MVGYGVVTIVEEDGFVRRAASLAVGYDAMMRGAGMTSFRPRHVTVVAQRSHYSVTHTTALGDRRADSEWAIVTHPLAL